MKTTEEILDRLLGVFVAELYSPKHDAGWHGSNSIARLITFAGDLPPPSGNDRPDDFMINEIRFVRDASPFLNAARLLVSQVSRREQIIVVVDRRYRGLINPDTDAPYRDREIARKLNLDVELFRQSRTKALKTLRKFIESSFFE